ncbi:MAG: class I SAM-dependent methyltransferase [Candidatus Gracilibacteria bacterium]|jgi:SAM-dependent methyltransferase
MITSVRSIAKRAKKATPEEYLNSSIIRFGRHDDYIKEKLLVDFFAIKGNLMIAEGLKIYIKDRLEIFKEADKIRILDVGPAIGAISTLLVLQVLEEFSLLEKSQVYLLDASQRVIDKTQEGKFFYPESILSQDLKPKLMKKIKSSKAETGSATKVPWDNDYFDITLAGFLFHHLHRDIKPLVAKEITRTLAPGGFLGIAEEWFEDYTEDYASQHKNDQIPLAYEDIISYEDLAILFPDLDIFFTYGTDYKEHCYTFCGVKKTS